MTTRPEIMFPRPKCLMAACCALLVLWGVAAASAAGEVAVSGKVTNPNKEHGPGASYRLTGETTFGWLTKALTGDINLNGHRLVMDTGGGNRTIFSGVLSGTGRLEWQGAGAPSLQTYPSFLRGTKPNTFTGTLVIVRGMLALAKPAGVTAHAGDVILGGGSNQAILRLDAADQIADTAEVRITGKHEGRIWTQGHNETVGPLVLQAHGTIHLGQGASTLAFADSRARPWDLSKTLTIHDWTQGKDKVVFGRGGQGLTAEQLARIGFSDPGGKVPGLYKARMLPDGQIVPDVRVRAVNPPFDVSDEAIAARRKVYEVPGLMRLTGPRTPLKKDMRIAFFGDSITWQNVYIGKIEKALSSGASTKSLGVRLINRGVNGGGVLSIRDGSPKAAYVSASNRNGPQAPFAEVLAADKADVAVVFIGINDVWWRKTSPESFDKALRDLVAAAAKAKATMVLATLTLKGEWPDGGNALDAQCDAYADITRKVAAATNTTLVDMRKVCLAYLRNHNAQLRVDGTLSFVRVGVLTYDGVHPTDRGNQLLAEHLAQGIYEALRR